MHRLPKRMYSDIGAYVTGRLGVSMSSITNSVDTSLHQELGMRQV